MAVFTEITVCDAESLLNDYDIGRFSALMPISAGIENTNYFIETQHNGVEITRWVLTIFENLAEQDLPYFCDLTSHLASDGFPVPAPVLMRSGAPIFSFGEKKGVIVPCLSGEARRFPAIDDCAALGVWVARMHLSLSEFHGHRPYSRSVAWMSEQADRLEASLDATEYAELVESIKRFERAEPLLEKCPKGAVHGDLFHDNVLFCQGEITGVIDFYNASEAPLLYDLAVAANDWTMVKGGSRDQTKLDALVSAYRQQRPWTLEEQQAWPYFLELAALSFWVSRLSSFHLQSYQKTGVVSGDVIKDPAEMRAIMRLSRAS